MAAPGQTDARWLLKGLLVLVVLAALLAPAWLIARRGGYRRRALLEAGAFFGAAVFAVLALALARDAKIPGDYAASVLFQGLHLHGLTDPIESLSSLGSAFLVLPVTFLLALLASRWSVRAGLYLVATVLVSTVVNVAIKGLFQRVPPDGSHIVSIVGSAFPSGHAMRTMTLAVALALILPMRPWRRPAAFAAILVAVLIGLSRVYLHIHFFSDVVGGWALGLAVACVVGLAWPGLFPEEKPEGGVAIGVSGKAASSSRGSDTLEAADHHIRVLLFDWGDTLMVDHRLDGPMAQWPEVESVPGAAVVLKALEDDYLIGIATNADDSGAELVEAALGRVGLARHVRRVYSSRDIGARKPDPAFYEAVLRDLDGLVSNGAGPLRAREVVMIGDSYTNDVAGAKAAGLRAVWFNREGSAPMQPAPTCDAEIRSLDELPDVLARLGGRRRPV